MLSRCVDALIATVYPSHDVTVRGDVTTVPFADNVSPEGMLSSVRVTRRGCISRLMLLLAPCE